MPDDVSVMLSVGDLAELVRDTGVSARTLKHWGDKAILPAGEGGGVKGSHRAWTISESLGVLIACRVYASVRGCSLSYVTLLVRAFGRHPVAHWRKLAARSPGLMFAHESGPAEPYTPHIALGEKLDDRVDVRQALADLVVKVEEMSSRPAPAAGRKRALAGTKKRTVEV
jgi:hypothetical protein